jgi:hypothetical protein
MRTSCATISDCPRRRRHELLRDAGVLSAEEFDGQKAKLLGNG